MRTVVCCHLLQGTLTGTVVHVTSCFKSRYAGQMLGWPASPTIILFEFNKIKIPKTHLPFSTTEASRCALRVRVDPAPSACLLVAVAGDPPRATPAGAPRLLRAEEGAGWGLRQHTHTAGMWGPWQRTHQQARGRAVVADSAAPALLPERDLQDDVTPCSCVLETEGIKRLQGMVCPSLTLQGTAERIIVWSSYNLISNH